jgi:hypothetical protein
VINFLSIVFSIITFISLEATFDTGWKRPENKFDYSNSNRLVIHLNKMPNSNQMKKMLRAFKQIKKESDKAEIKFVIHGPAFELFLAKKKEEKEFLNQGRLFGVQFLACHNTMLNKKIKFTSLYKVKNEDIVPAGLLEVSRLQKQGFSYIKLF